MSWELVESKLDRREDGREAWHFTFVSGGKTARFRVVGWSDPGIKGDRPSTGASRFTHFDRHNRPIFAEDVPSVKLEGECQVETVRDRLLDGLRDGSVRPEACSAIVRAFITDPNHGQYPSVGVEVDDLPDVASENHPAPWTWDDSGNGKGWLMDANQRHIVPLYLWDAADEADLDAKLATINRGLIMNWKNIGLIVGTFVPILAVIFLSLYFMRETPEKAEARMRQARSFAESIHSSDPESVNCVDNECAVLDQNGTPIRILCWVKDGCVLAKTER